MYVSTNVPSRVCCASVQRDNLSMEDNSSVQRDNLSMEAEQRSSYLPSAQSLAAGCCCTLVLAFLYSGAGLGEKELELCRAVSVLSSHQQ